MARLLAGTTFIAMVIAALPISASAADQSVARRCVCAVRNASSHVRVVRHVRQVAVRLPLRIGYDPLPYRFGYLNPPYRYIQRYAVVRVGRAVYR